MNGPATWPAFTYSFDLPLRYHLRGPANSTGTVVCLHGYQDHAASMLRRLGWLDRDDLGFRVLAINAPFPVPIWTAEGFTEAYAWYFRDATRGIEVGSPQMVSHAIAALMNHLGLSHEPTVIFGFSQGGFLAPALARELSRVRAIISLGAGYPPELYESLPKLEVFGLHGDADERVPIEPARAAHAALMDRGFRGEFITLPGERHRVAMAQEPLLRRLIQKSLGEG